MMPHRPIARARRLTVLDLAVVVGIAALPLGAISLVGRSTVETLDGDAARTLTVFACIAAVAFGLVGWIGAMPSEPMMAKKAAIATLLIATLTFLSDLLLFFISPTSAILVVATAFALFVYLVSWA